MQSKVWKKIETGLLQNLICAAAKIVKQKNRCIDPEGEGLHDLAERLNDDGGLMRPDSLRA